MRRFMRKPRMMSIRDFITRLVEINTYLAKFPPFAENQQLPNDEIMDIAEFAVPVRWQKIMVVHGFNPIDSTTVEFIEFCERLEYSEDPEELNKKPKAKADPKDRNDRNHGAKSTVSGNLKRRRGGYDANAYCEYCDRPGHDTGKCWHVLQQVHAMKAK